MRLIVAGIDLEQKLVRHLEETRDLLQTVVRLRAVPEV